MWLVYSYIGIYFSICSDHKSPKHIDPSLAAELKRFKFRPDKHLLSEVVAANVSLLQDPASTCEFSNLQQQKKTSDYSPLPVTFI